MASDQKYIPVARAPLVVFKKSQLFSPCPISFHVSPFIFPSPPLSTSCVTLVLLHLIAHKLAHSLALQSLSPPHTATNYGVNRSINREKRGRQRVNRQDSLREVEGTKEEGRGGEGKEKRRGEERRGHLIEMEIEQAN